MGFVAILIGLGAALLTLVPGVIAAIVHYRARKKGRGSWPIYIAITLLTAVMCFGAAILLVGAFESGQGAPTEEQYTALLMSAAICFGGPGLGMTLGAFALFKSSTPP
ncbi:MAG: hypothetical protein AAGE52_07335 [Myxococcota bacterium]